MHRGAIGGDMSTGDGAGILIQIPEVFFTKECKDLGLNLPEDAPYGVAMIFFPRNGDLKKKCMKLVEKGVESEGLKFIGWREVPVNIDVISGQAFESRPEIMQCFIDRKSVV